MGKKSASPMPAAPDPVKTIEAQTAANRQAVIDSARVNAVDLYGPGGSVTYQRNPDGTPKSQTTAYDARGQRIYDGQQDITETLTGQAADRVGGLPTTDFTLDGQKYNPGGYNTGGMFGSFGTFAGPYNPKGYGDLETYSDEAGQAAFDHQWNYSKDAFAQDTDRLMQNLQDRGLPVGGEAYNNAARELTSNHNRQIESMSNQARTVAGQEAQRQLAMEQGLRGTAFSEAMTTHNQNTADNAQRLQVEQGLRNTQTQENLLQRTQNFNEASAYLQGSPALQPVQAPNMPNYNQQATDVAGITMAAHNAQMQGWNAQQQQQGSKWQGAANLAGTGAQMWMMSSRAYKHDDGPPERILSRVRKLKIRTWRYNQNIDPSQDMHIGPYAEDWAETMGFGDGERISYIDIAGITLKSIQDLADLVEKLEQKIEKLEKRK